MVRVPGPLPGRKGKRGAEADRGHERAPEEGGSRAREEVGPAVGPRLVQRVNFSRTFDSNSAINAKSVI